MLREANPSELIGGSIEIHDAIGLAQSHLVFGPLGLIHLCWPVRLFPAFALVLNGMLLFSIARRRLLIFGVPCRNVVAWALLHIATTGIAAVLLGGIA